MKYFLKMIDQKGMSLVEVVMTLGIVTALGVGALTIIHNQDKAAKGTRSISDLKEKINNTRKLFDSPSICELNFKNKETDINLSISEIKNDSNEVIFKTGEKFNDGYELASINIGKHDPRRLRTSIVFSFQKKSESVRGQHIKRSIQIFTKVSGGKISECLDPFQLNKRGLLLKMCQDADPLKENDCEKTIQNLIAEAKINYCQSHDFLGWDSVNKKCIAEKSRSCPSGFVQAFTTDGDFVCLNL